MKALRTILELSRIGRDSAIFTLKERIKSLEQQVKIINDHSAHTMAMELSSHNCYILLKNAINSAPLPVRADITNEFHRLLNSTDMSKRQELK